MSKTAFVFAGQGAQSVGMGKELYENSEKVQKLFETAEGKRPGITELIFNGTKEELDITINTQPAVFLTDIAYAMALTDKGVKADGVAGFSLGEIPAVCFAGLMEFPQAFDFVCKRAKAMQECAEKNKGMMYAVLRLQESQVEEICKAINPRGAYPVNYNCPGQTVVACTEDVADKLEAEIASAGGKALKLAVSGAFHSPLMDSASRVIEEYLKNVKFNDMQIPIYANFTAKKYDNPKHLLTMQVNNPVLWQKTIENMITDGFDTFIEVGPGKTLSGLIKKINADVRVLDAKELINA